MIIIIKFNIYLRISKWKKAQNLLSVLSIMGTEAKLKIV